MNSQQQFAKPFHLQLLFSFRIFWNSTGQSTFSLFFSSSGLQGTWTSVGRAWEGSGSASPDWKETPGTKEQQGEPFTASWREGPIVYLRAVECPKLQHPPHCLSHKIPFVKKQSTENANNTNKSPLFSHSWH